LASRASHSTPISANLVTMIILFPVTTNIPSHVTMIVQDNYMSQNLVNFHWLEIKPVDF
jgi:hypothetical protein